VLDISGNPIGDDGVSLIIEQLKHNYSLAELNIETCNISAKGNHRGFVNATWYSIMIQVQYF